MKNTAMAWCVTKKKKQQTRDTKRNQNKREKERSQNTEKQKKEEKPSKIQDRASTLFELIIIICCFPLKRITAFHSEIYFLSLKLQYGPYRVVRILGAYKKRNGKENKTKSLSHWNGRIYKQRHVRHNQFDVFVGIRIEIYTEKKTHAYSFSTWNHYHHKAISFGSSQSCSQSQCLWSIVHTHTHKDTGTHTHTHTLRRMHACTHRHST